MKRKAYMKSCEISEVRTVRLGGYDQKISIEGKKRDLPVVICLHGGPGLPVPFGVGCRGLMPEWTDRAIMVYWDQLGCGINNYNLDNSFCVQSFVDMTVDLIGEIKRIFPRNKLFLFAISWGSALALKAAVAAADLLNGVVVYGQIIKNLFFNEQVYASLEHAPKKVRSRVAEIRADGISCEYKVLDRNLRDLTLYLRKYTNGYNNRSAKGIATGKFVKGILTSPDYTFRDFKAIMNNGYRKNESIWQELLAIDLSDCLARVEIPYLIFQGDTDLVTCTDTAVQTAQECGNANVQVKVLKQSGHFPSALAMNEVCAELFALTERA